MRMKLIVNGEEREFDAVSTLPELLAHLGLKPDRVAVELNRELIPRERWTSVRLNEGDKLEVVHFVGGGLNRDSNPKSPGNDTAK